VEILYKLLIVEDEPEIRQGLKDQVPWDKIGYTVIGDAEDGIEALDMIKDLKPDVALIDIRMSGMDGIQLMEAMRKDNQETRIIVISGYSDFEYARKCIELGVYAYLLKPLRVDEIEEVFLKLGDEIDTACAKQKEYKKMKENEVIHKDILKEKALIELVTREIEFKNESITLKELEKLGIRKNGLFAILQFGFISDQLDMSSFISFKEDMLKIIEEEVSIFEGVKIIGIIFPYNSASITIVLNKADECLDIENNPFIYKIRDSIEAFFLVEKSHKIVISAGVGRFYRGLDMLYISYREAAVALKLKFFLECNSIIFYEQYIKSIDNDKDDNYGSYLVEIDRIYNNIIEAVHNNKEMVTTLIRRFFNYFKLLKLYDIELVYMKSIELMIHISTILKEKNLELQILKVDDFHSHIREFIDNGTLSLLTEWIVNKFSYLMDELARCKDQCLMEKVLDYINANTDKKITLEDLGRIFFLNPNYLCSLFKQKTGLNFKHYITECRLRKSKELLGRFDLKIYEVSKRVGYGDFRHFSRIFKKYTGIGPVEYRKKLLANKTGIERKNDYNVNAQKNLI